LKGKELMRGLKSLLSDINPADIESITLLKDANATAIYGSQGFNGVGGDYHQTGTAERRPAHQSFRYARVV
jgi:TonB-dependent SusC/RagA subfamily outer membrane receptor